MLTDPLFLKVQQAGRSSEGYCCSPERARLSGPFQKLGHHPAIGETVCGGGNLISTACGWSALHVTKGEQDEHPGADGGECFLPA